MYAIRSYYGLQIELRIPIQTDKALQLGQRFTVRSRQVGSACQVQEGGTGTGSDRLPPGFMQYHLVAGLPAEAGGGTVQMQVGLAQGQTTNHVQAEAFIQVGFVHRGAPVLLAVGGGINLALEGQHLDFVDGIGSQGRQDHQQAQQQAKRVSVITSYSIHYTKLYERLHRLPLPTGRLDLAARLSIYLLAIERVDPRLPPLYRQIQDRLADLSVQAPVFCHNDLHAGNLLGHRPWVVDWEYAAGGDAAFELAGIWRHCGLDESRARLLLAGYRAAGGDCPPERVRQMLPVVDLMTLLWTQVLAERSGRPAVQALASRLLAQLYATG